MRAGAKCVIRRVSASRVALSNGGAIVSAQNKSYSRAYGLYVSQIDEKLANAADSIRKTCRIDSREPLL